MLDGTVLSLYDLSGVMTLPWAEAGYECFIVDIQHPRGCTKHQDIPNVWRWGVDLLTWLPPLDKYRICFSFSPCDDIAVSGSRWFVQKGLYALGDSIRLFARGLDIGKWTKAPYCCEHPKSTIVTHLGQNPDPVFHPWQFDWATANDDNYTKDKYIWIGNGFIWPRKGKPATSPDSKRIHYEPPSPERKISGAGHRTALRVPFSWPIRASKERRSQTLSGSFFRNPYCSLNNSGYRKRIISLWSTATMPQPEKKEPMKPADVINVVFAVATMYANCFTPFLRTRTGTRAYASSPFSFFLMLAFADYCRGLVLYIPFWLFRVVWMRLLPDRSMHSRYQGYPWLAGLIFRKERTARTLELPLVFCTGVFLCPVNDNLGGFVAAGAFAMGIVLATELEAIRADRQRMTDARAEMQFQARLQREDSGW